MPLKIILAEHAGFCFGVRRAAEKAIELAKNGEVLYSLGELIHNKGFVEYLSALGLKSMDSVEGIPPNHRVLIRSHGVGKDVYETLERRGIEYIDLTCPFVTRIHHKVAAEKDQFSAIVIVGREEHPEVVGIKGWAGEHTFVVSSAAEAEALSYMESALVVAQTTITRELFTEACEAIAKRADRVELFDSICLTTAERQDETARLAALSDAVLVIGDPHSSNSKNLVQIAKKYCNNVDFVESANQVLLEKYAECDIISIVAGASAPDRIIREVRTRMSELEKTQVTEEAAFAEDSAAVLATANEPALDEDSKETTTPEQTDEESVVDEAAAASVQAAEESAIQEPVVEQPAASQESAPVAESSFAEEMEKTFIKIKRGQFLKGTVVQVTDNEICVNIGYKSDGLIKREDLSLSGDAIPSDMFKPGDEIEAEVITLNDGEGNILLSRKKIENQLKWKNFVDSLDMDAIYECMVTRVIKGGVLTKFCGYDAFIPASQLSLKYVEDLNVFVGNNLLVKIIDVDRRQKRFVLSNKAALKQQVVEQEKIMFGSFEKGSVVRGMVKRLTDFGAFVDVGGVDGLLHITDISWVRIKHPREVLSENQEIDVKILNVDAEKKKISLGYKQLQPRPWEVVPEKYHAGDIIEGKVVRIAPFGAFVELEPTVDGLIHISQVTNHRIEKVEDILALGQTVTAKVLEVNAEKRRISLSIRATMEPEKRRERSEDSSFEESVERDRKPGRSVGRREERSNNYSLPPVEEATTSLADLFRQAEEDE